MSQHFIDAIEPENPVMIGFDRPLHNFFGTVFGVGVDDENIVHYVPSARTVDEIVAEMAPFAVIDAALQESLNKEIRSAATHPMTKHVDHRSAF